MRFLRMRPDSGQTLVEALVAIGIVVIALISILNISLSYISLGSQTVERTTAIFLAREGIEIARAIRDSKWLNPNNVWPYGLTNGNWIINYNDTAFSTVADNSSIGSCTNCKLYLDFNGRYIHTITSTPTPFRRMITISTGDDLGVVCPGSGDGCEKKIESKVYWTERGRAHQITLEERLTNWR